MHNFLYVTVLFVILLPAGCSQQKPQNLFNGENLDGFYTYLVDEGINSDPLQVFTVREQMIRISGEQLGYLGTNAEYGNYHLIVEYRWGDETFSPRLNNARDSGILLHAGGADRLWPQSIEAQIIEGGTGDIILIGGTQLTVDGVTMNAGRFDRFGKGPWQDVLGFVNENEVELPHGEWNRIECITNNGRITIIVNGETVNEGYDSSKTDGKILIQSEGAEIVIRKIQILPI